MTGPFRVFVGIIPTGYLYSDAIEQAIANGMAYCGARDRLEELCGLDSHKINILCKPDIYFAESKLAANAYTHPEIMRALATQVLRFAPTANLLLLAETASGFSPTQMLKRAGYHDLPIHAVTKPVEARYQLGKGDNETATEIKTSELYSKTNFSIYAPKLKTSAIVRGIAGAIHLGQSVDMLEVCNPDLVVSDGIVTTVGGGRFTSRAHELGVILVSNNAVAHDWIATRIFNLDPQEVPELTTAINRGWGPKLETEIELGGSGLEGIRFLQTKSKSWQIKGSGYLPVEEFGSKFEKENPSLRFPLEILCDRQEASSVTRSILLDWLYLSYDFPVIRSRMAKWPKVSIVVGMVKKYPKHKIIFAIGNHAIESLNKITSSNSISIKIPKSFHQWFGGPTKIRRAQLKNSKWHTIIEVQDRKPTHAPSLRDLVIAFFIFSFGKMGWYFLRPTLVVDWLSELFRKSPILIRSLFHKPKKAIPIVLTSRMPANAWWATPYPIVKKPLSTIHQHSATLME